MKTLVTIFICMVAPFLVPAKAKAISFDSGVETYTETGYDQFKKLVPKDSNVKILYEMSDEYIDSLLKELKGRFFGEREKIINKYADCTYVSETIFSRSNQTREPFVFSYDTKTVSYEKVSVSVKGTISTKGVFKGANKELTLNGEISGSYAQENSTEDTRQNKFSVIIYPGKKVSLRTVGECKLSNGVQKKYFFGITVKKGAWEVIDIISTCCELIEEDA